MLVVHQYYTKFVTEKDQDVKICSYCACGGTEQDKVEWANTTDVRNALQQARHGYKVLPICKACLDDGIAPQMYGQKKNQVAAKQSNIYFIYKQ